MDLGEVQGLSAQELSAALDALGIDDQWKLGEAIRRTATTRRERSQYERTRPEGPPSPQTSTSPGTTSHIEVVDVASRSLRRRSDAVSTSPDARRSIASPEVTVRTARAGT